MRFLASLRTSSFFPSPQTWGKGAGRADERLPQRSSSTMFVPLGLSFLSLLLILSSQSVYCLHYNKAWSATTFTDSLVPKSPFKYYLENHVRLIETPYVFNQLLFLGGLGYQFNEKMVLLIGPGYVLTKTVIGDRLVYEERFWQQFGWHLVKNSSWNLHSRTRLEERKINEFATTSLRFRERLWLRIPFVNWKKFSFSTYDEVFLNLNHPVWASPYLIEQNRAFVGLSYQLVKSTIIDIGYLNQYLHSFLSQKDNVALISFIITK